MKLSGYSIFLILFLNQNYLHAAEKYLNGGFGNFEGINIGLHHQFGKKHLFYGYGNDLNLYGQGFYNCLYVGGGIKILQKYEWAKNKFSINLRTTIWNIENKSNIFSAISFFPELHYAIPLNEKFKLNIYGGYGYSSVFRYKRKGYFEVGWPDEWLPNFGVSLQYLLK